MRPDSSTLFMLFSTHHTSHLPLTNSITVAPSVVFDSANIRRAHTGRSPARIERRRSKAVTLRSSATEVTSAQEG